jgi:pantoate--beta-alanine ligase
MGIPEQSTRSALPRVIRSKDEIWRTVVELKASGNTIGVVPTMGALHAGHLSLVERSAAECHVTVVTVFVNPTQFGPKEDLAKYPRDLDADLNRLGRLGVDLVFAPSDEEMYPPGHSTFVEPPRAARGLEGQCRPGHFRGVVTIVLKLLNVVPADAAYFGQKDYQQSVVVRRMVEDLDLPVRIVVCPTIREPDGLAMSSRNTYLNRDQREQALAISRSLQAASDLAAAGQLDADVIRDRMRQVLLAAGIERIDYVALVEGESLQEVREVAGPVVALVAAFVGETRLIDNMRIG